MKINKFYRKIWVIMPVLLVTLLTAGLAFANGWPSTNELNMNAQNPSYGDRYGADNYVSLVSVDGCEVTLEFVSEHWANYFEYRIDGKEVVGYAGGHYTVDADGNFDPGGDPPRDIIYPGVSVNKNTVQQTFNVEDQIEVRLAYGGEQQYYFDWVTFESEGCGGYTPPEVCGEIGPDGKNLSELARNVFGNELLVYDLIARYNLENPDVVHLGDEFCLPRYTNPGDYLTGPDDPNIMLYTGLLALGLIAAGGGFAFYRRKFHQH
jgi:hypothetical protein